MQRLLTQLVEKAAAAREFERLSPAGKALITSNSAKWASTWLVTIPVERKPWLYLSDEMYRLAMQLRLGLKAIAPDVPCVCGRETVPSLQSMPWHPLSCSSFSPLWSARHDGVKQLLASIMTMAGASVMVEPTPSHLRRAFEDGRRPDLLIHMGERTILADVTIKHPLAPSYVRGLAQSSLGTALEGERIKNEQYAAEAKAMLMEFVPISLETTGGWGPAAQRLVKSVAKYAGEHSPSLSQSEALRDLIQGSAIAIQRGNAYLLRTAYQRSARAHAERGLGVYPMVPALAHILPPRAPPVDPAAQRGRPRVPYGPQPIRGPMLPHSYRPPHDFRAYAAWP